MTLSEFLLARIAEDEASLPSGFDCWYPPERYAVECDAKRRIVELHAVVAGKYRERQTRKTMHYGPWCSECGSPGTTDQTPPVDWPCPTLRLLALPYADHPEYREEWRP